MGEKNIKYEEKSGNGSNSHPLLQIQNLPLHNVLLSLQSHQKLETLHKTRHHQQKVQPTIECHTEL